MKKCCNCNIEKDLDAYNKRANAKDGKQSICRECSNSLKSQWRKKNPEKNRDYYRAWLKKDKNKHKNREKSNAWYKENSERSREYSLKQKYDITLEQYNKMYTNQNGCCAICGEHQDSFSKALAVDHCHSTKEVRGLLCTNCNTALGSFKDNVSLLFKAVEYLINPPYKDKD